MHMFDTYNVANNLKSDNMIGSGIQRQVTFENTHNNGSRSVSPKDVKNIKSKFVSLSKLVGKEKIDLDDNFQDLLGVKTLKKNKQI